MNVSEGNASRNTRRHIELLTEFEPRRISLSINIELPTEFRGADSEHPTPKSCVGGLLTPERFQGINFRGSASREPAREQRS